MSWAVRSETIEGSLADLRWQAQALCRLVPRHARIRGLKFPAVTGARIQVHIDRPHRRDSGCWRLPARRMEDASETDPRGCRRLAGHGADSVARRPSTPWSPVNATLADPAPLAGG